MQTARFSTVVERAGRPEPYLSWAAPDKDAELKRLLKANRVMTVHQQLRGPHKDYGTVGLHREGGSDQILVFPKSLARFAERRIVGIDYAFVAGENYGAGPRAPAPRVEKAAPRTSAGGSGLRSDRAGHRLALLSTPPTKRPESPATARAARPEDSPYPSREELVRGIKRALGELKAGKAVAAYERLQRLVVK